VLCSRTAPVSQLSGALQRRREIHVWAAIVNACPTSNNFEKEGRRGTVQLGVSLGGMHTVLEGVGLPCLGVNQRLSAGPRTSNLPVMTNVRV